MTHESNPWSTFLLLCLTAALTVSAAVKDRTGFFPVPAATYSLHDGSALSEMTFTSSAARLFYTFIKADEDAENKPLFLFFNGGPGSGTSCGLMGFYTGRKTLDNRITGGGDRYIDNPWSWTGLGNLLYIDARCAGFSYGLLPEGTPRTLNGLSSEFLGRNFNSYTDAADYIRVLLGFLAEEPQLRDNPVIIVGESYGGVRATLMLNMLLHYPRQGNGEDIYQDGSLVDLIQNHIDAVFSEYSRQVPPSSVIARQFSHQVLIQPAIDDYRNSVAARLLTQPDSLVYQIAAETGTSFVPCNGADCSPMSQIFTFIETVAQRDIYGCHKPAGWTDSFFTNAAVLLPDNTHFSALTGQDAREIESMKPAARTQAYHYAFSEPASTIESAAHFTRLFGPLLPYDSYYSPLTEDGHYAYFYLNAPLSRGYANYSYDPLTGEKFLENLLDVKTFITNAKFDLVVYTNALPEAFGRHTEEISASLHQTDLPQGAERPGQIEIRYRPGAFAQSQPQTRLIRFPFYTRSSHPVSLTEPEEFFSDVRIWIEEQQP